MIKPRHRADADPVETPEPELSSTCLQCGRATAFEIDECVYCASRLVATKTDLVRLRAINSGRPGTRPKKRRR
jgi:hypothetical protein